MAKGITEATVEEIKARVDLADLISSYGIQIKIAGASKKACCPFHHEKTPSFNINDTKGFYHCFGCGESGDAIKFVMKYEGLSFVEAVRKLADQVGVKIEEREDPQAGLRSRVHALLAELAQFYHRCLAKTREAELARRYVASRDLSEEIQEGYLIGYAPSGVGTILKWAEKYGYSADELEAAGVIKGPARAGDKGYHRFGGRLVFAIRDKQGRVVGFSGRQLVESKNSGKYVNSPETVVFKKSNVLYGFDKAMSAIARAPNREVIVCEGQIDCIRLQTSGFANAVAGQGTAFTQAHVAMLKKVADQVALVYDDDAAGHKATIKSARLCLAAELPVRVVSLPNGDDPDSYLRTHASEDFRTMLDGAESIMNFQVRSERAKEKNPDSVDAVKRISKELLLTIAQCPSAILRATMSDEAAKLLNLPRAAFAEELEKIKNTGDSGGGYESATTAKHIVRDTDMADAVENSIAPDEQYTDLECEPEEGETAGAVIPPPESELEFCAYLLSCEYALEAAKLNLLIGEFLPEYVFSSEFVRNFVNVWRTEIEQGKDLIAPWSDALPTNEHVLFGRILLGQNKNLRSELDSNESMREWIAVLWRAYLKRKRGLLPAVGDVEIENRRLKMAMDIRRINSVKWDYLKTMIRDWIRNDGSERCN